MLMFTWKPNDTHSYYSVQHKHSSITYKVVIFNYTHLPHPLRGFFFSLLQSGEHVLTRKKCAFADKESQTVEEGLLQ